MNVREGCYRPKADGRWGSATMGICKTAALKIIIENSNVTYGRIMIITNSKTGTVIVLIFLLYFGLMAISDKSDNIDGAFGYTLGSKVNVAHLAKIEKPKVIGAHTYGAATYPHYRFKPKTPMEPFTKYDMTIVPSTKSIASIHAYATFSSANKCKEEEERIFDNINYKYRINSSGRQHLRKILTLSVIYYDYFEDGFLQYRGQSLMQSTGWLASDYNRISITCQLNKLTLSYVDQSLVKDESEELVKIKPDPSLLQGL